MKTTIQTTKILLLTVLMALGGMHSASAQLILHGIPGGDLTGPTGLSTNPIAGTTFTGEGYWNTQANTVNRSATIVGSGVNKHIELWHNWNTTANVWYVDNETTPSTDTTWTISTTLAWSGQTSGTQNALRLYSGVATSLNFEINIDGTTVNWTAGAATGSFTSATGLDLTQRTVSLTYNPVTGFATGMLGAETVFNSVSAGTGLLVKTVLVSSQDMASPYNAGTLSIYNISAVPEPYTGALLVIGLVVVGVVRRRVAARNS